MNLNSYTIYSTRDNLVATAQALLQYAGGQRVWLLEGAMGTGKTTLVSASPTFPLVHEYATSLGTSIYHFDFYRIQCEEEVLELDCTTYFESNSYCFVEWPERLGTLTPSVYCKIRFTIQPDGCRVLHVTLVGDAPTSLVK